MQTKPVDAVVLAARLTRIQYLADALARVRGDAVEQHSLSEQIQREIQAAKFQLMVVEEL